MSTESGIDILLKAIERAQAKGRADDTEQEAKVRAFLDDLHKLFIKHFKTVDNQTMMKAVQAYMGLLLRESLGPIFAALLAMDLCTCLMESATDTKEKKS